MKRSSLICSNALAVALVLCAQSFQQLFSLTLFAEYVFYIAAAASVFVFRLKEPNASRPYRTWGYPVVPVLFIVGSLFGWKLSDGYRRFRTAYLEIGKGNGNAAIPGHA